MKNLIWRISDYLSWRLDRYGFNRPSGIKCKSYGLLEEWEVGL